MAVQVTLRLLLVRVIQEHEGSLTKDKITSVNASAVDGELVASNIGDNQSDKNYW